MSDNNQFFSSHNPRPDIAIPTRNGYFFIPNPGCPSSKVEEGQEQEMVYEKQEHEEDHEQDTEATFALIEQMLIEDGKDRQEIHEILGSLDSCPDEFARENLRLENLKVELEEEEKGEFDQEERLYKWREDSEDDEIEARENALLELLEERENQEWRDHMIAQRMQQEEEENVMVGLEKLGRGNPQHLVKRKDKRSEENCPICLDVIPAEIVFYIEGCEHGYHIECLEQYIVTKIDENAFPIKCPFPECRAVLNENDVKDSLQTKLEYQIKYEQMSFRIHVDSHPNEYFQCPTPDCKFICNFMGVEFHCPMCKKAYCKECKTDWHHNMSCVQYQEQRDKQTDQAYEESARGWGYKRCPQCQVFVERTEGCNAMVCSRCQTQFCYTCGKRGDGHNCTH